MKAILEFDLPDDREKFINSVHAYEYVSALCEISEKIRSYLKHHDLTDNEVKILEDIRGLLYGLELWDV